MKESITQEFDYGCGIACYAFALGITYREAANQLGDAQAKSHRFWVKDFRVALNRAGLSYVSQHHKPNNTKQSYVEGAIVLIRRSKNYPAGHYLIRHGEYWMDPWINLPYSKDILKAKSGYRKRLPGRPMYVLSPMPKE